MTIRPNAFHMARLYDFPAPFCPLPADTEHNAALDDPLTGEFSDIGREPLGWPTVLLVLAAIFVPLLGIVGLVRGLASMGWTP